MSRKRCRNPGAKRALPPPFFWEELWAQLLAFTEHFSAPVYSEMKQAADKDMVVASALLVALVVLHGERFVRKITNSDKCDTDGAQRE